ncbi:glycoside hydrolase family 88 protein [Xylanibacter muris]|uniref:glycoside hydrolase family 88 protein n=2 Tax=Xylanibacter muris TaxID=2736290 RepID=UPI001C131469
MKRLKLLLLCLLLPAVLVAGGWDTQYRQIEQSIRQPQFASRDFNITKYGASTKAKASENQKAINKAIAACSKAGGGRVIVPSGIYNTGAITLKSHVNLVVEKGAVLMFAFEPELYPVVLTRWEGLDCWNISPCVYAYKETDIAITGEGTIDGGGTNDTWWKWCGSPRYGWKEGTISQRNGSRARLLKMAEDGVDVNERKFGPKDGLRPQLININQCDGILIENVTLLRSPFWVIHPLLSKNITVRGVHINNDGPNGDGCDPESCDGVLIENCYFNTGDDCIAIKSGRNNDGRLWGKPSQNIIIRNCKMQNGHGGVVIGSEISGGCRNVFAENNKMDSPNLDRVIRIKTNTCRGGVIENIYARNIEVGQCGESVLKINLDYERNEICCRGFLPTVRNINLENITCQKSKYGVQIIALDTCTNVYDINVRNCKFNGVAEGNFSKGMTRNVKFENLYINGGLVLQKKPYKNYSQWMTYSEMKRVPESYLLDFSKKPKWSYVMGIELEAMLDTYLKYGGDEIKKYCQTYTDTMINEKGEIRGYKFDDYNLDNIRTGHFVSRMYEKFPEPKNLKAMKTLMKQMEKQPRTLEGVYWHKAVYAYQVWLDGIFMGLPYRALTANMLLNDKKALKIYDDAVDQVKKTYERTLDPKTGLNRHAWDETREMFWADKETGLSQHCWGRAQGWYTMALIELLDALPENYSRRAEVIELLRKDLDAVIKWQDKKTGVWYQVMDTPKGDGNYLESTCSAMFAYSLLKAYRKGYLGAKYRDAGIRAYRGIINNFIKVNPDETISLTNCCSVAGLGPGVSDAVKKAAPKVKENRRRDGSYKYYLSEQVRDNDAKGVGPFIWASLEMEALGFDTYNSTKAIDRMAVVSRNNPVVTKADPLSSLSVGDGHFAATVDFTGLQSFPVEYENGVPLTTMSEWGWHSFENIKKVTPEESQKSFDLGHGRDEVYAVEYKQAGRNKDATDYFRINPHRLNLGALGIAFKDEKGNAVEMGQISGIRQELKLWDGVIESKYNVDNTPVEVTTGTTTKEGYSGIFTRVKSRLLGKGQACLTLKFPYPTGKHADAASDWKSADKHETKIIYSDSTKAVVQHKLDAVAYYVLLRWDGNAKIEESAPHCFTLASTDDVLSLAVNYFPENCFRNGNVVMPLAQAGTWEYDQELKACMKYWPRFWNAGAIADFSECTDMRAKELERRTVLSQYLTYINCANDNPPQETGLTYNSWFGRPHLEMTWWHMVDFALWKRPEIMKTVLDWYNKTAYPEAEKIAHRQGFKGVRWMKMTDPDAGEAPSNTGSFLIWQQPHYIYMAEEMYRANPSEATLNAYGKYVEATAEFMADYAKACDRQKKGKIKLFGQTAMQESMSKDFSYNHPFDQAYWRYGLTVAQKWRERMGKERNSVWDDIISRIAPLAEKDGIYMSGEPLHPFDAKSKAVDFDPYKAVEQTGKKQISAEDFAFKSRSDHPAVLGACGLLPSTSDYVNGHETAPLYNKETMKATLKWVMKNWNWATTWGWDYGMIAMCAARLGETSTAVEALLIDKGKNTYLVSGHNFQEPKRLRLYLPGNGSLLDAVAMMCAGWDGCAEPNNPGFPKDGRWNVRWEGLQRMQ